MAVVLLGALVTTLRDRAHLQVLVGSLRGLPGVPAGRERQVTRLAVGAQAAALVLLLAPAAVLIGAGLGLSAVIQATFAGAMAAALRRQPAARCPCAGPSPPVIGRRQLAPAGLLVAIAVSAAVTAPAGAAAAGVGGDARRARGRRPRRPLGRAPRGAGRPLV
jgi:hypothetical protein